MVEIAASELLFVALVGLKRFWRGEEGSHSPYSVNCGRGAEVNGCDDAPARNEGLFARGAMEIRGLLDPLLVGDLVTNCVETRGVDGRADRARAGPLDKDIVFFSDMIIAVGDDFADLVLCFFS